MSNHLPFGRMAVAIMLTGVTSSFAIAFGGLLLAIWKVEFRDPFTLLGAVSLTFIFWIVGSLLTTLWAILVGLLVELPKAVLLKKGFDIRLPLWVAISIIAGAGSSAVFAVIKMMSANPHARASALDDLYGNAGLGALGGFCSGLFWWLLVKRVLTHEKAKELNA